MKAPLFDKTGTSKGTVDLQASHFEITPNLGLIHRLLILQQANGRIAIAHTKTRGNVRGSTRKIFRQKGNGRARMGSARSPIRRGGGIVFGPSNMRNFSVSMNRQERRLALLSLMSQKATHKAIKIVETFEAVGSKTKEMSRFLETIEAKKPLLVITREEKNALQGAQNLINTRIINVEYLNPHDLLKYQDMIFSQTSLDHLYQHFSK